MPSSREGFGIVFLEAAFFGKPSIASTAGGSPEVVIAEKTGLLVDPGDIESLSAAIIELLSSKDRREQLGRQAHERVNNVYCFARFKCLLKEYLGSD
jgi:glycosyltransferase involved in cell wall biosynthesis